MTRRKANTWDVRFMDLAMMVASWSKDPSTKVGAVLVNDRNEVMGMGYNGFARGVQDLQERLENRDVKYELVVHAEVNAILTAGHRARGCRLYVAPAIMSSNICPRCADVAVQAGVKEVLGYCPIPNERWAKFNELSTIICDEGKIETVLLTLG